MRPRMISGVFSDLFRGVPGKTSGKEPESRPLAGGSTGKQGRHNCLDAGRTRQGTTAVSTARPRPSTPVGTLHRFGLRGVASSNAIPALQNKARAPRLNPCPALASGCAENENIQATGIRLMRGPVPTLACTKKSHQILSRFFHSASSRQTSSLSQPTGPTTTRSL